MDLNSCHLTCKPLQEYTQDRKKLQEEGPIIEGFIGDTVTLSTVRYAQLSGFMFHFSRQVTKAKVLFTRILDVDPENLNALGNLIVLYKDQCMYAKARELQSKLKALINEGGSKGEARRARAAAEQAYAIQWFEQDKRDFGHLTYFEEAARLSEHARPEERLSWKYQCRLAVYRLYLQLLQAKAQPEDVFATCCKAVTYFNDAIQVYEEHKEGNPTEAALCWVFIGIILLNSKELARRDLFKETSMEELAPTECFNLAMGLNSVPSVIRRVGEQLGRPELKEYEKALEMLDEALEKDRTSSCWFCHNRKGVIYFNMYRHKTLLRDHSLDSMLQESLKNFKMAVNVKQTHGDFAYIGQIHMEVSDYPSAIEAFRAAVDQRIDDLCDPVLTHRLWAKCLEQLDELEGAEEQHFTASRVEQNLMRSLAGQPIPGFDVLRPLSVHRQVEKPRNNQGFEYDFFVSYSSKDEEWVVGVLVKTLEEKYGFKGLVHYRDFQLGKPIINNIIDGIDRSFKTIIVLSEDFLESNWCRYEMQQAHCRAMKDRDDHMITILYRPCEVPAEISHLTYLECKTDGQLGPEDWGRLEHALVDMERT